MNIPKRLMIAAIPLLILIGKEASFAQDGPPRAEIFAGYHLIGTHGGPYHGWNVTGTGNFNNWFGLAGSVSGNYKDHISLHSLLVGPEFSIRPYGYGARIFVNSLFGISRRSAGLAGLESSKSAFSFATLAGIELTLTNDEHLCVRLVQAGYQYSRFPDRMRNQFLLSTGLVLKLGN